MKSTYTHEFEALVEELMETRQLNRLQAQAQATTALHALLGDAQAWDYVVEQTQAQISEYAQLWDAQSAELRRRTARRSPKGARARLAA